MIRIYIHLLCLIVVLASCGSKNNNPESSPVDSVSLAQDKTAVSVSVDTALIAAEIENYKTRISERITEYDEEIGRLNVDREKEKDKAKKDSYSISIQDREKSRKYLQERLEMMKGNVSEDWKNFKEDIEHFFEKEPSGK